MTRSGVDHCAAQNRATPGVDARWMLHHDRGAIDAMDGLVHDDRPVRHDHRLGSYNDRGVPLRRPLGLGASTERQNDHESRERR